MSVFASYENTTNSSNSISRIIHSVCKIQHKIDYFIIHKYNNCNYKDPLSLPLYKIDNKESVVRNCEDCIRHDKRHSGSFVTITDYQLYMRSKTNQVSRR